MCWSTNNELHLKKKIASFDMDVCKFGYRNGSGFMPYVQLGFLYDSNKEADEIRIGAVYNISSGKFEINAGYHSYMDDEIVCDIEKNYITIKSKKYSQKLMVCLPTVVIGRFYIPKGGEYYKNEYGEVVSNKIVYTGEWYYAKQEKNEFIHI